MENGKGKQVEKSRRVLRSKTTLNNPVQSAGQE
jgi:hypothetical protein